MSRIAGSNFDKEVQRQPKGPYSVEDERFFLVRKGDCKIAYDVVVPEGIQPLGDDVEVRVYATRLTP